MLGVLCSKTLVETWWSQWWLEGRVALGPVAQAIKAK